MKYGRLPRQMAAICDSNMRMFDLGAEAAVHRSKQYAEWALMMDPLTAAVCSPAEINELTRRLFEAEAQFLPGFK
jgi:alpha-galactosidase